ncbi:MAG: hypothetical protein OER96_09760, partial [Gammaproteobacteria bacterium]|nr:hypothetical protein [Gammaproteobacteria bacterium]
MTSGVGKKGDLRSGEKQFAFFLTAPSLLVLIVTTTFPLAYLIWSSFQTINLAMPYLDGFAGFDNYIEMWDDS